MSDVEKDLVQIAKLALAGKDGDLRAYAKRAVAPILRRRPDLESLGKELAALLETKTPLRGSSSVVIDPLPVDLDSRQELLRREDLPMLPAHIVWPTIVLTALNDILVERQQKDRLIEAGLTLTRTILFVGPPGVGKTLAARWLASHLQRPLLTLDLAAVMSSYLGKTGNNIRTVLEFAKKSPSLLLLDEFDAIAKRRDDSAEVGELKRLVTVLLQAIDEWPFDGILIAATNHPELLDPAVWRRFDRIVEFPRPTDDLRARLIEGNFNSEELKGINKNALRSFVSATSEMSFSEVKRELDRVRRQALVSNRSIEEIINEFVGTQMRSTDLVERLFQAEKLIADGFSQRKIHEVTGLSRDTLRGHFPDEWAKRRSPVRERK